MKGSKGFELRDGKSELRRRVGKEARGKKCRTYDWVEKTSVDAKEPPDVDEQRDDVGSRDGEDGLVAHHAACRRRWQPAHGPWTTAMTGAAGPV